MLQANQKKVMTLLAALAVLLLSACGDRTPQLQSIDFSGPTMGTTYHVTLVDSALSQQATLQVKAGVDSVLLAVNVAMSTYMEESEISRFNRERSTYPVPVSPQFQQVVHFGLELCELSSGAFDITVMPMVNFYGFGFEPGEDRFPTVEEIDDWLNLTGCDKVIISEEGLTKIDPAVTIDLSAIAKGFGADAVGRYLTNQGFSNCFIEVGGEVVTRGLNLKGSPWRIGIDRPNLSGVPGEELQHIIGLENKAVATSGDYRNYRDIQGSRVTHMMDPRNGYPITHSLASVSVIASDCMVADGIATMLMILGVEEGMQWLADHPGNDALFISRLEDGSFKEEMTAGFSAYLVR